MQEAEEQDTCRICSAPAEPDQPLFHPCKCSGTIRYIHQDCLTTWLAHSKKKNCDVCKHPYSFTKVYAPDMPSSLPPVLLVRRLTQQTLLALLFGVRAIAVAIIWLAVLPWVTVWTWRMYFSMGESTAWWISDLPRPTGESTNPFYNRMRPEPTPAPLPTNILNRVATHPLWLQLSVDIFTGQIIASLIVLTFVAVFLLREWISQNARPGVFEDEEVPPDEPPPPLVPALAAPEPEAAQDRPADEFPNDAALEQRQAETLRRFNEMRNGLDHPTRSAIAKQKMKAKDLSTEAEQPARARRRLAIDSSEDEDEDADQWREERMKRRTFSRRIRNTKMDSRRRVFTSTNTPSPNNSSPTSTPPVAPQDIVPQRSFDFTFRPPAASSADDLIPAAQPESESSSIFSLGSSISGLTSDMSSSESLFAPESDNTTPMNDAPPPLALATPANSPPEVLFTTPVRVRRPPLPTTTLPNSGSNSPFVISPARTPLESPSLATYRPPEELEAEAGPSRLKGYFDRASAEPEVQEEEEEEDGDDDDTPGGVVHRVDSEEADLEAEHRTYFAEVQDEESHEKVPHLASLSDSDTEESDEEEQIREGERVGADHDDLMIDRHALAGMFHDREDRDEDNEDIRDPFDENEDEDGEWDIADLEEVVEGAVPAGDGEAIGQDAEGRGVRQVNVDGVPVDIADDLDANVEDDMDGALEAIGMRGPIYGVFQNAALMIFVLDTAIGLGVWVPFTIGKSTALLSLNPHRFLQIIHLPIRAMRLVTDPVVDSAAYILIEWLFPPVFRIIKRSLHLISLLGLVLVGKICGQATADRIFKTGAKVYFRAAEFTSMPFSEMLAFSSGSIGTRETVNTSNATSIIASAFPEMLGPTEPYFTMLGKEVRLGAGKLKETWIQMAMGGGPTERTFAVVLGYAVVGLLLSLYLNLLTVGNARSAGRAVRSAVRQQLLVLKVAAFIFIELVTFPLGCGIVLDLCTVWLFPEANFQSRLAFFVQAPLTAMFYHWVAGTMFMYSFAVLLSGCRTVMRPGAMWFIKDPQDQNSHPIRDILDRPTLTQLRKICVSGLMYSFVVVCVVGSVAGLLILGSKSIMPFRWKNREPLSNIPVDLLFLHLVLPYTMHYFRPKSAVKILATELWKFLAARLRLTSYFFGGRHTVEEQAPKSFLGHFIRNTSELQDLESTIDGTFRRVPATDNLALPRDMRATAAVTEDGEPIDEAAKKLIDTQNAEAEKARRNIKDDYMVVYIPPYFRYRIICFIVLLWIIGAISLGVSVTLPIQLGRSFFRLFTPHEVHDGYSLIIGFYLLWACYLVARSIDRLDKRRQRRSGDGPRGDLGILVLKRGLLWAAKTLYMVFFLGIVIPILVAFVMDLYIVLPIRFTLDPSLTPKIRVVDTWALGLLYAKIAIHANRIQPPNQITRGIQHITSNGWTRPDPITATKEVIGPVVGGLLGMILFPGAVFRFAQYLFPNIALDDKFIFMHVYPGIFMLAGLFRSGVVLYDLLSSWSQSVRDKEFLVEMRLRNHEPEKEKVNVLLPENGGLNEGADQLEAAEVDEEDDDNEVNH
ncbi:hypothetical protein BDQ12DRAFT_704973 [Crucibulum laeve]|uniref:RING-type E3 ubiquitin transferase n=1 Tax=Crucibulum laeve TaxID=68775 RepID=A0A5C3M2G7_9AGAR|nr:hypothetical protein BDQ12DRAFT_704973 [Crucibulum laeve]